MIETTQVWRSLSRVINSIGMTDKCHIVNEGTSVVMGRRACNIASSTDDRPNSFAKTVAPNEIVIIMHHSALFFESPSTSPALLALGVFKPSPSSAP